MPIPSENDTFVKYSMLCNTTMDGDGPTLAAALRASLKAVIKPYEQHVSLKSCRYLSDGEIRAKFSVEAMSEVSLTDLLYSSQDKLGIEILEAGAD